LIIAGVAAVGAYAAYYFFSKDPEGRSAIEKVESDAKSQAKKLEGDAKNAFNTAEGKVKGAFYDAKAQGNSARAEGERMAGSTEGTLKEAKENVKSLFK
jgi:hypothetical protein